MRKCLFDVSEKARHKPICAGKAYVLKGFYRILQITNSFLPLVQCFVNYTMHPAGDVLWKFVEPGNVVP